MNDALLGTMMEFGEAKPFDIVGSGRIRSIFLKYASDKEERDELVLRESKGR
ncbi:hypothetical protein JMK10_21155 [Rhodovulum sulfidophilum]|uniref:hypothetical protein n=1 Tax=Rhodovulum sulfidophilum TaxID=35806 RepID=UPI001921FC86|nr:hypothetical protein [Rhodovulum sulfidophilum]MBL3576443.1 hypothetical protein [Rhodovulum sulfidophilum]MCE8431738.1 hypothetical protein [Rhodovulum sulfidophilum]MCF4119174.1 hypothetical protein [Rhodovulum sulfidophilum]